MQPLDDNRGLQAYALDPLAFAQHLLHWTPDPNQARVLSSDARRVILNCARQWGKTTLAAAKIVHFACTRPGSVVLIVSENLDQTGWVFRKIDHFLGEVGLPAPETSAHRRRHRRLGNGALILGIAAREEAVRSYTADFVFLDEAARIEDEVIDALEPALAVRDGDLWMASTPRGRRGRFFETFAYTSDKDPALLKLCIPVSENPRITAAFVERIRAQKGDDYVRQEFECQFIENGTNLMSLDQIDSLPKLKNKG